MTTLLRLGLLMSLLAAVGCGGGTADVSGKVTFKGKPVTYGTVMILGSGGLPKSGVLRPDGTFTVTGVPLGPVKVAVSSPRPPGLAGSVLSRFSQTRAAISVCRSRSQGLALELLPQAPSGR